MNTSQKRIKSLNIVDDISDTLSKEGEIKLYCFIINWNIKDFEELFPVDSIIEFLDKENERISYEDFVYICIKCKKDLNDYLSEYTDFTGFVVMDTENTIYVLELWKDESSDIVYDLITLINELSREIPELSFAPPKDKEQKQSSINMFNFFPLNDL